MNMITIKIIITCILWNKCFFIVNILHGHSMFTNSKELNSHRCIPVTDPREGQHFRGHNHSLVRKRDTSCIHPLHINVISMK